MNIYTGNLSWDLNSNDLEELFAEYGEVTSAKIITDKFNNNRSKGFGFVEMPNEDEAKKAIDSLNGAEVSGRKIVVNEKQENGGGGFKKRSYENRSERY